MKVRNSDRRPWITVASPLDQNIRLTLADSIRKRPDRGIYILPSPVGVSERRHNRAKVARFIAFIFYRRLEPVCGVGSNEYSALVILRRWFICHLGRKRETLAETPEKRVPGIAPDSIVSALPEVGQGFGVKRESVAEREVRRFRKPRETFRFLVKSNPLNFHSGIVSETSVDGYRLAVSRRGRKQRGRSH